MLVTAVRCFQHRPARTVYRALCRKAMGPGLDINLARRSMWLVMLNLVHCDA
jgi:hypothetical protein